MTPDGSTTMHAALVTLVIAPTQAAAAAATFTEEILPAVRAASGFVGGYWLDPASNGQGFGFVLFETEEDARNATPPLRRWEAPGVTIEEVTYRRVAVAI